MTGPLRLPWFLPLALANLAFGWVSRRRAADATPPGWWDRCLLALLQWGPLALWLLAQRREGPP